MTIRRQRGATTVEFAIVGLVLMVMIFGVFEVGRAYYTAAMLEEVTRRGARLAAVCPINDPAIAQLAILNASGDTGNSQLINGLAPGNVVIDYIDEDNAVVADPGSTAGFLTIRYVRARISGFTYQLSVPFVAGIATLPMPEFTYLLPRESLGVPREGAITPC
jgi:Flp pilus assembly protein TadG